MANPLGGQKDNISREGMNIYVKQKEIAITVGQRATSTWRGP